MAEGYLIDFTAQAKDNFDFSPTDHRPVGVIKAMTFSIGGKPLKANIPVTDPLSPSPEAKIQAVCVITKARWKGGPTDPIYLKGNLTPANRGAFKEAISSLDGGANVDVDFTLYDYDTNDGANKFYECFTTDGKPVTCILTKNYPHDVDANLATEVEDPPNYEFEIMLTGKSSADQTLNIATDSTLKFVRQFGVALK